MPLFRFFSTWLYWAACNFGLSALLWLELVETGVPIWPKALLLSLLCADGGLCCMFYCLQSKTVEVETEDFHGAAKTITVPGGLDTRCTAAWLHMLLLSIATANCLSGLWGDNSGTNFLSYIAPLLILLRNEDIWPACFMFIQAVGAAGPMVYLWLCLLLLLSGMGCVLLHGQYSTGDDYTDSQFYDFYHALSTMSVFLIDGVPWLICSSLPLYLFSQDTATALSWALLCVMSSTCC